MRVGIVLALVAVALGIGGTSLAGTLPDLPGMHVAENAMSKRVPQIKGSTSSSAPADTSPASAPSSRSLVGSALSAQHSTFVRNLPGGKVLPTLDASSTRKSATRTALPLGLAALVVALWTRFLFRLNALGRTRA